MTERGMRRWIRLPWRSRTRIRTDIDDEFQFHLDMRVAELRAQGLAPERAHAEAMRRFGDVSDAKEYCRTMDERSTHEEQRRAWFAELGSDVRFATRQLRHSPIFTTLAIVTPIMPDDLVQTLQRLRRRGYRMVVFSPSGNRWAAELDGIDVRHLTWPDPTAPSFAPPVETAP